MLPGPEKGSTSGTIITIITIFFYIIIFYSYGDEAPLKPCTFDFPTFDFQIYIQKNRRLFVFCSWTLYFMSTINDNHVIF